MNNRININPANNQTIKSILNQTFTNYEFIIVDDNSVDNTISIILKYIKKDNRIKIIKNDNNYGCYISKNIALQNIKKKSEYIASEMLFSD